MSFDKVIGTGLDNLLARTVGDAVKVASRQDPGHDGCKDNNAKQQDKNMGQGPPGIFLIGVFSVSSDIGHPSFPITDCSNSFCTATRYPASLNTVRTISAMTAAPLAI